MKAVIHILKPRRPARHVFQRSWQAEGERNILSYGRARLLARLSRLKPGVSATAEDIIEFYRDHFARFKAPRTVAFSELAKTLTGKIQNFALRERVKNAGLKTGKRGAAQPPPFALGANTCFASDRS